MEIVGVFLLLIVGVLVAVVIGMIPGWIAKSKNHPQRRAIEISGLVGIFVWPAWFVALVWAFIEQRR